jgi:hypothetical protein
MGQALACPISFLIPKLKRITIPSHASERMLLRGATENEVREAIIDGERDVAKSGRFASRKTFEFNAISPINNKRYALKTVEVIWIDEPEEIVVVTTKVYYHNT